MRILMTTDAVGGVWQYSLDLAAGLSSHRIETVLTVLGPHTAAHQREAAERIPGLRLLETGLPLDWLAGNASEVKHAGSVVASLANRHGVDLVHLNSPALAATPHFDVPVLAVCHSCVATWWAAVKGGRLPADFSWRAALMRSGMLAAAELIAPSRAFADALVEVYGLPTSPTVIHNGRSAPGTEVARDPQRLLAFSAGRLWDEGKNIAALDRAAARLKIPVCAAGPLVGPNGARVALSDITALGTLNRQQMDEWLGKKPIFVSTALYEPFGLGILEAAQVKCPLVLSDIPTFRELWSGAAVFVDPRDDRAIADAVAALAGDEPTRRQLGEAAAERARLFTVAAMADRTAESYRKLLSVSDAQRRAVA